MVIGFGERRRPTSSNCSAAEADYWFESLHSRIRPLFDDRTYGTSKPVKVAVLDTGCQFPDSATDIYRSRLKESRSWLDSSAYPHVNVSSGWIDEDGHGTHTAGLILDVAENAELYVARVAYRRDEGQGAGSRTAQQIAIAIYHAIHVWKVDIISMSLGFEEEVECIRDALLEAYKERVLVVAAASNHGGNEGPSWPATSPLVLAIHASTGLGRKYTKNPTNRPFSNNFSTLGVDVESWIPEHLGKGVRKRSSGTSCAAPIAAAIAAIVMAVARQPVRTEYLSRDDFKRLRRMGTSDGMASIFRAMVPRKQDEYDVLVPWEFLDCEYSFPQTIVDDALKRLGKK